MFLCSILKKESAIYLLTMINIFLNIEIQLIKKRKKNKLILKYIIYKSDES